MRQQQKNHIKLLLVTIICIALLWIFLLSFAPKEQEPMPAYLMVEPVQPAVSVQEPSPIPEPAPLAQPEQPGGPIPLVPQINQSEKAAD